MAIGALTLLFITAVVAALIYLWNDLQTNSFCSLSVPKLFYTFLFGFILGAPHLPLATRVLTHRLSAHCSMLFV